MAEAAAHPAPTGNVALPWEAELTTREQEAEDIATFYLRPTDPGLAEGVEFIPGQFNMLYLFGVGEVPISIVSDPAHPHELGHTIRAAGRATTPLIGLQPGDRLGVRGPFGAGWPLEVAEGRDVLVVTGGLGCAPVVSVINYILARRERYGRLFILQGVKHAHDLIWRDKYEAWATLDGVEVGLAADIPGRNWPGHVGLVTELFDRFNFDAAGTETVMCGPEPMMRASARDLVRRGFDPERIWLSMERSMKCGRGKCGHCQLGPKFVCREGPVFPYTELRDWLEVRGV